MTWPIALSVGLGLGFGLSFYVYWLPLRIKEEEAYWVAKLSGGSPGDPTLPKNFRQALVHHAWFGKPTFLLMSCCGLFSLVFVARNPEASPGLVFFSCTLLALAVIDWRTQLLPDDMTLGLLWVGLLLQLFEPTRTVGLEQAVIGAVVGYLVMWVTGNVFALFRGIEGLGYGDMKLLAAIGAWLGSGQLIYVLLLGSVIAVSWQLAAILRKKSTHSSEFAFGPWLITAALIRIM